MSRNRKKLAEAPPGSAARLRLELAAADRFISVVTWGVAAGMIAWSILNATPYVADHLAPEWRKTAFVLPLVVDLAFLGALRADEIASRHGVSGGLWAGSLRLFTGAASVFLNIGHAAEKGDRTGVFQHLITPGILVLLAEAGPVYRKRLGKRLDDVELEEAAKAGQKRQEQREEADRRRRQEQEDADRQAKREREEADRRSAQEWHDELKRAELEDKREAGKAARALEARRLELEEKRLTATVPAAYRAVNGTTADRHDGTTVHRPNGMTAPGGPAAPQPPRPVPAPAQSPALAPAPAPAGPVRVPVVPVASAPRTGVPAPQARTGAAHGATVAPEADSGATAADSPAPAPQAPATPRQDAAPAVAAAQTAPARVITARVEDEAADQEQPPARPVKDWQKPGLPADCAPGRAPELLIDAQVTARIDYGLTQGWTQRRIGEFAGRSATVVNRRKKEREKTA